MSGILVFRHLGFLFLLSIANLSIHSVEGTNTTTPEPPTPPPQSHFAPGPDVSLDRFYTFDPALLAAPPSFPGDNCTTPPISLVPNGAVTVILPPPISDNCTDSFESLSTRALNVSLPYLLEQIGVPHNRIPALVAKATPIFEAGVKESVCLGGPAGNLSRRGFFDDLADLAEDVGGAIVDVVEDVGEAIVDGVEDVGEAVVDGVTAVGRAFTGGLLGVLTDVSCSFFAAGALPLYLSAAGLFVVQNVGKAHRSTTPDQDFFIFPLHGPISHDDDIRVVYDANFPPTFGGQAGVTMGRNIYVRSRANTIAPSDSGFPLATKLLLHEFAHSKQYRKLGYNLPAFGSQYLFNYCKVSTGVLCYEPTLL
jgi:hypothetical protein